MQGEGLNIEAELFFCDDVEKSQLVEMSFKIVTHKSILEQLRINVNQRILKQCAIVNKIDAFHI